MNTVTGALLFMLKGVYNEVIILNNNIPIIFAIFASISCKNIHQLFYLLLSIPLINYKAL